MAERPAGKITDEGVARLRERIGVPEPWPLPPHYQRPNVDSFLHVAEAYGDDNPLWCDPAYGEKTVWGGPIASPVMVGGDTLIGEDEVTAVPEDKRDLMKGDPLRGVHAFYSASAREWWAPLRPDHRVFRRNAMVAVLDKASEFAGRAIHEWSANVFQADDGTILSGQYRLMIRTEREKAQEKGKYKDVEFRRYTDDEIEAIDAQYVAQAESRRGAEPRFWEDVAVGDEIGPMVKGPLTVTDMVCWHVGMGMGLYGVRALDLAARESPAHPALLPPRRAERARRDAARPLGPGVRPQVGEPHHVRLRAHARDLARPPLHQLDGRRRVALEARLRVPGLQLRRRHAMACGARSSRSSSPTATDPRCTSTCGRRANAASSPRRGTPRSCCPAVSTVRCACRTRPAARRTSSRRSPRSARSSRRGDRPRNLA